MRLLILSDLHHDFWADANRDPFQGIESKIAELDHVLLAGDISNKPKVRWARAFEHLATLIPLDRISIFPGNHDFYDFRFDDENRLADISASFGINYAQKTQIRIGTARILCATLWTDLELGGGIAVNQGPIVARMNDYRKIRVASAGYRRLRPSDVVLRHREHLDWLDTALHQPFDGKTYVATHHAPHPAVLQRYSEGLDAAYASDLTQLIGKHRPEAWFFGHSHDAKNITLGETALRNVSLGYPEDVPDPGRRITTCIFDL